MDLQADSFFHDRTLPFRVLVAIFKLLVFFNVLVKVSATVKRLEYEISSRVASHGKREITGADSYSLNLRLAAPFPYFARATHGRSQILSDEH
ncbi:hypothetical protein L596_001996 [Steinernema carpocapsae]|uniref:Uncharacterized protein n=1 Tax=Steinernema carpocapsae TaxID=34508 RepID=A0A4U8UMR5_STECR|nr:hypothetical protein L596_001996 [Steinernema carpocapsae]